MCHERASTKTRNPPAPYLDEIQASRIARAFKAIADPTRLRLIAAILNEERCVHELCDELKLEQSVVSHQLRVLRDQNLVRHRKDGRHVYYVLDDVHVRQLFTVALDHVAHAPRGARP